MRQFSRSLLSQERIAGGALVLACTQLLASVMGFFRDQAFSITFPVDTDPVGVASVYIAAFRPSDLLFQMTVMSCLSVVLVPFLAGYLKKGDRAEMSRVVTSTMIEFSSFFGLVALILAIIIPWVAQYFVHFEGETLALYIRFGRIALLTNFLFVFGNTFGQYLITVQRYWVYGITPIIWAICTIAGTYLLTPFIGMMGPIVGTLIGTLLYVVIRYAAIARQGFRFLLPAHGFLHGDLRAMGLLIIPRMLALGALQVQLLLLDRLASGLETQIVALNQFARNFESVIPGIVGIALAQSVFSLMSQAAADKNYALLKRHLGMSSLYGLALSIPGAFALAALTSLAAWMMHLSGDAATLFRTTLVVYAFAIPFESVNHLFLRSFYSLKNTLLPALSSVLSSIAAVVTATFLLPSLGIYALAGAYVVGQVCQTVFLGLSLLVALRKKVES